MRGAPARLTPTRVPSHHSANHSDPNNHGHLSLTLTPRSESRQVLRLAALRNTTRIRRCASHNNLKQKRRTNGCPARTPSRFIIHSKAKKNMRVVNTCHTYPDPHCNGGNPPGVRLQSRCFNFFPDRSEPRRLQRDMFRLREGPLADVAPAVGRHERCENTWRRLERVRVWRNLVSL